jgi:hypothetical protein
MDPDADADPAIFIINLQNANKNLFKKKCSAYYFLKVHLHHFSKIKVKKKSQKVEIKVFSYNFCFMIEGSGSIPLTNRSGSGSSTLVTGDRGVQGEMGLDKERNGVDS